MSIPIYEKPIALTVAGNEITDATRALAVQGDGRSNDSSYGIWEGATNLLPNGGFETTIADWDNYGSSATLTRLAAAAKFGGYGMRVAAFNANGANIHYSSSISGITPGVGHVLSCWMRSSIGTPLSFYMRLVWGDTTGAQIGYVQKLITTTTDWQRFSIDGVAPAGTVYASILFVANLNGNSAGDAIDLDGVQLEARGPALPALTVAGNEINDGMRSLNVQGDGLGPNPSDSSYGIWEAATNLITNGSLETNLSGWSGQNGATLTRITSDFKFGVACGNIACNGTQFGMAIFATPTLTNGVPYTFSVWVKRTEIIDDWRIDFSSGGLAANYIIPKVLGWQRVSVTAVSSSTAASLMRIINMSAGAASTIKFDGAQLEGARATPYVHTDGSTATRPLGRVQAPTSLLNGTQGWVAIRLRVGWSNVTVPSYVPRFFEVNSYGTDWLGLYIENGNWAMTRWNGGGSPARADATIAAGTFAAGSFVTLIGAWTATQVKISVNGSAFTAINHVSLPSSLGSLFDIGGSGGAEASDSDVFWFACGTGTLSDADAAYIGGGGMSYLNSDPNFGDLPGSPTALWKAESANYLPSAWVTTPTPFVNTSTAAASRSAGARVRAPVTALDETQGFAAVCVRPGWSAADDPHGTLGNPILFQWADDANNRIGITYDVTVDKFRGRRLAAGAGATADSPVQSFKTGELQLVVLEWTATTLALNVNGGAFVSVANSSIPVLAATLADIGTGGTLFTTNEIDGEIMWASWGNRVPTQADTFAWYRMLAGGLDPRILNTPGWWL